MVSAPCEDATAREVPVHCAAESTAGARLQGRRWGAQEGSEEREMVKFGHEG